MRTNALTHRLRQLERELRRRGMSEKRPPDLARLMRCRELSTYAKALERGDVEMAARVLERAKRRAERGLESFADEQGECSCPDCLKSRKRRRKESVFRAGRFRVRLAFGRGGGKPASVVREPPRVAERSTSSSLSGNAQARIRLRDGEPLEPDGPSRISPTTRPRVRLVLGGDDGRVMRVRDWYDRNDVERLRERAAGFHEEWSNLIDTEF